MRESSSSSAASAPSTPQYTCSEDVDMAEDNDGNNNNNQDDSKASATTTTSTMLTRSGDSSTSSTNGGDGSEIEIQDVSYEVFLKVLEFLYTDTICELTSTCPSTSSLEMGIHLLIASERFMLDRLKALCEDVIRKQVIRLGPLG